MHEPEGAVSEAQWPTPYDADHAAPVRAALVRALRHCLAVADGSAAWTARRVVRAAEGRRMPWKNGGGETIELLAHPPGAGLEAFDWRVSLARVAADGPFSAFPGIDRTLTILDGEGLDLAVGDGGPVRLTPASAPFAFPADAACTARLLAGAVTDLNVMTRRGRFAHAVDGITLTGPTDVSARGGTAIVFCRDGEIAIDGGATSGVLLGRHDAVVVTGGETLDLAPRRGAASALVISIRPG